MTNQKRFKYSASVKRHISLLIFLNVARQTMNNFLVYRRKKNLLTKSDIFQREQFVQASSFSRRESKDIARQAHIAFCR